MIKVSIAVILGLAVLGGVLWITYARPIVFCAYLQEDSIDAAFCDTYEILSSYDEQPEEAIDWVLTYHGEAPNSQVMFTLAD